MSEGAEVRLRRLRLRSWRRGIREMDLILGPFADGRLADLPEEGLAAYERMLQADDQDLYAWVSGRHGAPDEHSEIIETIRAFHGIA